MIKLKKIIFVLIACSFHFDSYEQTVQRYNTFSYNVNEGLLQSTIVDLAFDKNNFCWISFPNGIQKFDGNSFITVPVQPGLPDDKEVHFFRCSNGELFISHSMGISKYDVNADKFLPVYNNKAGVKTPAIFIGEDESIIYFYTHHATIAGINNHSFKVVSETETGLLQNASNNDYSPKMSDNIINHKVALTINYTLYLWDLKQRKLLYRSAALPDISFFLLTLKSEHEVLYYNYKTNNALQLYNFATATNRQIFVNGKDNQEIYRCVTYKWQSKPLLSFSNKLFETDTTLSVLKAELINFQNHSIAGGSSITRIKEDNFGNLYVTTIRDGIKKIIRNNYPFKYYGTANREDNYILSILPDKKNNRILVGSTNGLFVFDTLQRLIKHIETIGGRSTPIAPNTIIKNSDGNYFLYCWGEKNVLLVNNALTEVYRIPISTSLPENRRGFQYFGNFLFQDKDLAITQSQGGLYRTHFVDHTVIHHEFTNQYTMSGILHGSIIISHANDELIFLDAQTFKVKQKVAFKNTGGVRCFARDAASNIYVGSNKGIFKINSTGKILDHRNKEKGLPDECIYAMAFDDEGFLWCSSNKGIFKVAKNNSIFQLTKEDGLQENEFNTNAVAKSFDGEIFFGGVNGVSSFYPAAINSFQEKINILFTKIKINNDDASRDSAVWSINKIDLPYNQNSLSFDFIAMANNNPGQYIYQYKMKGVDKQWIQNNGLQTVRYFLPSGTYVFQVYASRFFNKDARPMKELHITIHQPFWKTWWFVTSLAVLFITMMTYVINQYNRRKYWKRLVELENEHKIQTERERISRDLHDSIGAYANAVLYNTELLQQEDGVIERMKLMKDLKFASKDIITSLRETIWALKKDSYTAEECLLRIKNFVQALSRYYPHIHFKVEGRAPIEALHYTKALNVVRILQEAVTNAIKHAASKNVVIRSIEKEGKWELTVEDDGKGYNTVVSDSAVNGNGLHNMKYRAKDSAIDFSINSFEGSGTIVRLVV